jgi:hypothetical protein
LEGAVGVPGAFSCGIAGRQGVAGVCRLVLWVRLHRGGTQSWGCTVRVWERSVVRGCLRGGGLEEIGLVLWMLL